jgi:hypothetical protein
MKKLPKLSSELDSEITNNVLKKNFNILSPYFYKLITDWEIRAYKPFHDIEKYLILSYLISKDIEFYRRNNINISYDLFYKEKNLEISKINLIQISKDLCMPKESERRNKTKT